MRSVYRGLPEGVVVPLLLLLAGPVCGEVPIPEGTVPTRAYTAPLVVPAAAFLTDGIDPDGFLFENGHIQGHGSVSHLVAPVYLPHGARVTGLRAYVLDNSGSCGGSAANADIEIFLSRVGLADGALAAVAITTSDGASSTVDFTPTFLVFSSAATIDNNEYAYWLDLKICSVSHRLMAVVIEY